MIIQDTEFTLKVLSFQRQSAHRNTVIFLQTICPNAQQFFNDKKSWRPSYLDYTSQEHLYSGAHIDEWLTEPDRYFVTAFVEADLRAIQTLMNNQNASYFRLID